MQNKVNSPLRGTEQIRIQASTRDCRKFNQFPATVNCRYSSQSESSHISGLGRGRGAARLSPHRRTNAFGRARAYTQDARGTRAGKGGGGWLRGGVVHGRDDAQIAGLIVSSWRTSEINRVCGSDNLFLSVSVRTGGARAVSIPAAPHPYMERAARTRTLFMFLGRSSVRHAMVECNLMECSRCLQLLRKAH